MDKRLKDRLEEWALVIASEGFVGYRSQLGRMQDNGGVYIPTGTGEGRVPFAPSVAAVEAAVTKLPEVLRETIKLQYLRPHLSVAKRARLLKVSESAYYNYLRAAHTILQDDLYGHEGNLKSYPQGVRVLI